jgi:ubiquinone/menaquinone biosynthesis C-methylase UbiE
MPTRQPDAASYLCYCDANCPKLDIAKTCERANVMEARTLETSEDLSHIAFGFMASKALFGALHVDLFTKISEGAGTIEEICAATKVPRNRIVTLTTALYSIGVLTWADGRYGNSPAAEQFLVQGAKYDFGDYLRYQIDQQMYPFLQQLNQVLDGTLDPEQVDSYAHWMSDAEQAVLYSEAQHSGSLGPGRTLARTVDLSSARQLLDVGGGTGAMTISLCKAYPELQSTIIDFPNVAEIGWRFVADAELVDRVRYIPGNALEAAWPSGQDAILMSYLMSGVPGDRLPSLCAQAYDSLEPGGVLMVHDFMVEPNRRGPALAALWQLQHMAFTPDARSIATNELAKTLETAGFEITHSDDLIPSMTKLIVGKKPS